MVKWNKDGGTVNYQLFVVEIVDDSVAGKLRCRFLDRRTGEPCVDSSGKKRPPITLPLDDLNTVYRETPSTIDLKDGSNDHALLCVSEKWLGDPTRTWLAEAADPGGKVPIGRDGELPGQLSKRRIARALGVLEKLETIDSVPALLALVSKHAKSLSAAERKSLAASLR